RSIERHRPDLIGGVRPLLEDYTALRFGCSPLPNIERYMRRVAAFRRAVARWRAPRHETVERNSG
ncbi:MAG: hypothetical protein ACREUG_18315, partial [Steroidobacteraceae bacterium]